MIARLIFVPSQRRPCTRAPAVARKARQARRERVSALYGRQMGIRSMHVAVPRHAEGPHGERRQYFHPPRAFKSSPLPCVSRLISRPSASMIQISSTPLRLVHLQRIDGNSSSY